MIRWISVNAKLNCSMAALVFFVRHRQEWNGAFDDPEDQQPAHDKCILSTAGFQEWKNVQ